MQALVWRVSLVATLACVACASPARTPPPPASREHEIRDADIQFYQARAERDPTGGFDLARLGSLYLQRGRETGDPRDAERAEEAARRSLRNRRAHNDAAQQVLASSLLAQHRFDEALVVAKRLRDQDPTSASQRATVAEIEMELGQYDSAKVGFASLGDERKSLAVAPRLARWAEIRGHTEAARRYMRDAITTAAREPGLPREQLAWFWLRAGDIELRDERFAAADSAYHNGLAANPGDYRLLSGLARLASVQHRWRDAIKPGEDAIASVLDPATLGILSDAYAAIGDTARAEEYARVLDVAVAKQPGAYHRAWSLFLLDHDRHVDVVSAKIREEMKTRRDVYAYDLLAWSLHKQGRHVEAAIAMKQALAQGTRDPQLARHAAIIAACAQ